MPESIVSNKHIPKKPTLLDPNTIGKSPAALYLVDCLNQSPNLINRKVLKVIAFHREHYRELAQAVESYTLSKEFALNICNLKKLEIENLKADLMSRGVEELISNLCCNILTSEVRQIERKIVKLKKIEISAIARAKSDLKLDNIPARNVEVPTVGLAKNVCNSKEEQEFDVNVIFEKHGIPLVELEFDISTMPDDITDELRIERSKNRLVAKGKPCSLYAKKQT